MPYNAYPYTMYNPNTYTPYQPQTVQPTPTVPQSQSGIVWVDGEVGAKAQQLPAGWPANTPMPLWDTNDTVIYLKSTNPMGMPNPLQKLHYTMEEQPVRETVQTAAPALMAGEPDGKYATKEDLEAMKEEIRRTITEAMADREDDDMHTYTTKGG